MDDVCIINLSNKANPNNNMNTKNDMANQFDENSEAHKNTLGSAPPLADEDRDIFDFDDLVSFINDVHMDILESDRQSQKPMQF